MATPMYVLGTFPKQFLGGGIARSKFTPNSGGPGGGFKAGGTVFAGGTLQNNAILDSTFGTLNYPYQGQHNQYNDNKPNLNYNNPATAWGITKALSGGSFSTMVAGQYVMLTFNSQLAGVATSVLRSPGSSFRKSENRFIGWINSTMYNSAGGFYMFNGLPVAPNISRDQVSTEVVTNYASPGKLSYWVGSPAAKVDSYKPKSD